MQEPDSDLPQQAKKQTHRPLWFRITAWIAISLALVFAVITIAAVILLHNERFHNYVLNTAQKQASEALGVPVTLQNFAVNLSNLSLDVYGVTVHGAAPYADPPLLRVNHALVGVRIVSVLRGKWYLDNFRIDHPVVWVFTDSHGASNIPTIKSSGNSSNTSIFDLGIRHAMLDNGEVYYNNRQSVLAADLHDVEFRASFNVLLQKYSGSLSYADGHLNTGSFLTIPHNLNVDFDVTPTTFHLNKGILSSGTSQLQLTATLRNYSKPVLEAHYDATLDGSQFRKLLQIPSLPTGMIHVSGSLNYKQTANRTLLDSVSLAGDLNSQRIDVRTPSMGAQVNNLAAHYSLENGDATLLDLRANVMGGQVKANGKMSHITGDSHTVANATLHGVSLADLKRMLGDSPTSRSVAVTGVLNAQANASWGKTFDDLVAHADATIQGQTSKSVSPGVQKTSATPITPIVPLNSALHATYTARDQQLALTESYLRTTQTSLTMNGVVGASSSLNLQFQSNDLAEMETIANIFRTSEPGKPVQPLDLSGTASFSGSVQGSITAPHLTGQLTASNVHLSGSSWRILRTNVDVSPSFVSLLHGELEPASHGRITFNASIGLQKWSFTNTSPIQLQMDASQLDIADLEKLSGQQIPVTGILAANINMHGTQLNPAGQGSVSLTHVVAYDEPVQSAKLTFNGTGDEVHADFNAQLPAGTLESKLSVRPHDRSYTAKLTAMGVHLDQLAALKARHLETKAVLNLNGEGHGTFDNIEADVTLQIPRLEIQNQVISDLALKMNVANHFGTASLTSSAVNTSIRANAKVNLSGDYLADATLDTQAIPLQPLLAVYAPAQAGDITGQTEVHATLHGPLKNKNLLEAHVTIPVLKVAYSNTIQLAETAPIRVDYKNNMVTLQRSAIHGTGTDLQFQGSIPTTAGTTPMSLLLVGTIDLKLAQLFDPDIRSSGQLKFNINSSSATDGPDIGGQINIVDANFASGDLPVGLQHANGVFTLTKDRLNINSFEGTVGSGTLRAQGGIAYRPNVQFDLGLTASGVRVLYPQGMRENVSADLRLAGSTDNAVLGGSVRLSDLSFTPAFDFNNFIGQFSGGVAAPPTRGFSQNLQLNVAVRSQSDINLVSRTLSIGGSANLQVRGTAAQPVILGRVNLNNGDIILNGTRFLLSGGTIEFVNPSETEPVVNLAVNTTIQQYNISLRFNGPIEQMRTNYSSDPSLPAADIINLLAFGKTTEAGSADAPTPANQAAESMIASQVSSQVTSRVSKIAGISQLSINPVLASGSNQGLGANVTIQQRVTGNLFITFSSNVGATQSQTISGQYQLSPRVAVSATRDQNGGFAFDTQIKKSW